MEMQTRHITGCMTWLKCELRNEGAEGCMLFTHGKVSLDLHPVLATDYILRKIGQDGGKLRKE